MSGVTTLDAAPATVTHAAHPSPGRPTPGGAVTIAYQTTPTSFDPAVSWEVTDCAMIHQIYQGFFRYAARAGEAGTALEPCLATAVPTVANGGLSSDGRTITIHLRPGVRFQPPLDREVTADDFVYSFERMMNPRATPLAPATYFYMGVVGAKDFFDGRAPGIAGFEALDSTTIRIALTKPDPSFLHALSLEFCDVVPREWVERWGADFARKPLGTGPFMLDRWTTNREVVLRRNPSYWERGLPYLDEIRYALTFTPDHGRPPAAQRSASTCSATASLRPTSPGTATTPRWSGRVHSQPLFATTYLFLNVEMTPFDDVRVRQAVAWAIDRDKLVGLLAGEGRSLYQVFPPGLPGHQPDRGWYGYDPEKARALLAEAGLPGRLLDLAVLRERRTEPATHAGDQRRPCSRRHQGRRQAAEQRFVRDPAGHAARTDDGQLRLVDGLPRPHRLGRAAVHQGAGRQQRRQLELLVERRARAHARRGAIADQPGRSRRPFQRDAGADHGRSALHHPVLDDQDDDVLGARRWLLSASRVRDRPGPLLGRLVRHMTGITHSNTQGVTMTRRTSGRLSLVLAALLVAAIAVALVAGCGSSTNGGSSTGGTGTGPKMGGTLNVSFQGEPTGLDPAVAWEVESWSIEHCIFNQLLTYKAAAGPAIVVPDIATEVPSTANGGITNGGKTYIFHIRPGVKFQAPVSRDVTATDVKWSFERMMNPKAVPLAPAGYLYDKVVGISAFQSGKAKEITGVKVIDPQTIEFDLTQPDYTFNYVMSLPFTAVMAKEWVDKYNSRTIARHPLGTGPFVFDHWSNGQQIILKKNPDYFVPNFPYLDTLDFEFAASASTAVLQLQSGKTDVLGSGLPSADYVRTTTNPQWKSQVATAPQIGWYYVFMNVKVKPFDNLQVRQAMNYAIDTNKILKLLYGQAEALNQVFPSGMAGHVDGATFYSYDPAKAKALLAQAGYPNGFSVTFYTHNVDPMPKLAQSIQNDLAQVGVKASIKQLAEAPYWDLIARMNAKIPIGLTDWYMDYPDPTDWIGPLFSKSSALTDGGANVSWWWDPQLESLYAQAKPMTPGPERTKLFEQMQQIIMQQAPVVPLYQPVLTTMSSKSTGGFYTNAAFTYDFPSYWKK